MGDMLPRGSPRVAGLHLRAKGCDQILEFDAIHAIPLQTNNHMWTCRWLRGRLSHEQLTCLAPGFRMPSFFIRE